MITLTVYLNRSHDCGYKYLLQRGCTNWTAFKTAEGFRAFLDRAGLKIDPKCTDIKKGGYVRDVDFRNKKAVKDAYDKDMRILTTAFHPRKIDEAYFWSLDILPETAVPYTGLSNGSYVTCYYDKREDGTTFYLPNPNAEEVYVPLDIHEHIAFSKTQ